MKKKRLQALILLISAFSILQFSSCEEKEIAKKPEKEEENKVTSFDRTKLLTAFAQNYLEASFERSRNEAKKLSEQFENAELPLTDYQIEEFRKQWLMAKLAWARNEKLEIGKVYDKNIFNHINWWEPSTKIIDRNLFETKSNFNQEYIDNQGTGSKGFSTIEYLLFDQEVAYFDSLKLKESPIAKTSLAYLKAISKNLSLKSEEVYSIWKEDKKNFVENAPSTYNNSLSTLVNKLYFTIETVYVKKIAKPLGKKSGGEIRPNACEALRSEKSLNIIQENIKSVEAIFQIGEENNLYAYIDFLQKKSYQSGLSEDIKIALAEIDKSLKVIEYPLSEAIIKDKESVENAYQKIRILLDLVKVDVANILGVTISITDNDGD